MKSKLKDLLYLIGYILMLIFFANAIFVKLQGGVTFVPSIIAIIGLFAGGYGIFSQTSKLLDTKHNKIKKIVAIASPFIILIVWALIAQQIIYQQTQDDKYEIRVTTTPYPNQEEIPVLEPGDIEAEEIEKIPENEGEDLLKKDSLNP